MILSGYIVVLFRWFIYVLFSQSFRGLLLSTSREGIGPHGFMLGHHWSSRIQLGNNFFHEWRIKSPNADFSPRENYLSAMCVNSETLPKPAAVDE